MDSAVRVDNVVERPDSSRFPLVGTSVVVMLDWEWLVECEVTVVGGGLVFTVVIAAIDWLEDGTGNSVGKTVTLLSSNRPKSKSSVALFDVVDRSVVIESSSKGVVRMSPSGTSVSVSFSPEGRMTELLLPNPDSLADSSKGSSKKSVEFATTGDVVDVSVELIV